VAIEPSNILLTGRVAVVTAGGAGIGRGVAAGMAAFGASVAIWERDPQTFAAQPNRSAHWESWPMSATATRWMPRSLADGRARHPDDSGRQRRRGVLLAAAGNQRERLGRIV